MNLIKFSKILLGAALLTGTALQSYADDTKVDPSGSYVWTVPGRNGGPDRTNTLSLKLDGDKLTGNVVSPGRGGVINTNDITDATFTNSTVAFSVTRAFNGNSFTIKYSGTVADGTITGKSEFDRDGNTTSRDWKATLQK